MTQSNGEASDEGKRDAVGDRGSEGPRRASGLPGRERLEKIAGSTGSHSGSAYQGAMEAVFAVVVATGIGYWADSRFGTSPRWLIVGAIVGFGALVLRLARMAKLVTPPMETDAAAKRPRPDARASNLRDSSRIEDPSEVPPNSRDDDTKA